MLCARLPHGTEAGLRASTTAPDSRESRVAYVSRELRTYRSSLRRRVAVTKKSKGGGTIVQREQLRGGGRGALPKRSEEENLRRRGRPEA
jgi:hypothetical protein